jgi:hypothetical protein
MYFGSIQSARAELDSGNHPESARRQYQFAELDAGEDGTRFSRDFLAHTQSKPAELGASDDRTYTTQPFGQYPYGIAELSNDDGLSYEVNGQILAPQQQAGRDLFSFSRSLEGSGDWPQNVSPSNSTLLRDHQYDDVDYLLDGKFHTVGTSATSDGLNETGPLVSPYAHPTRYYDSSMRSGGSTDNSWGNSAVSTISTLSVEDTSRSCSGSDRALAEIPPGLGHTFFDESSRIFSEPEEIERFSPPSADLLAEFINAAGSWDTPLKDINSVPVSYPADVPPQEG